MSELMYGLEFARANLDDLLVLSKYSFENHFIYLEEVFTRLASAGLKVNASKSHFYSDELEYLRYLIYKKVEVMVKIEQHGQLLQ
jgi:hypothetical protein